MSHLSVASLKYLLLALISVFSIIRTANGAEYESFLSEYFGCNTNCSSETSIRDDFLHKIKSKYPKDSSYVKGPGIPGGFYYYTEMMKMSEIQFPASVPIAVLSESILPLVNSWLDNAKKPLDISNFYAVYFWYFLSRNLDSTQIANYDAPLAVLKQSVADPKFQDLEKIIVLLKACESVPNSMCGKIYQEYLGKFKAVVHSSSLAGLIQLTLEILAPMREMFVIYPFEYFPAVFNAVTATDNLNSLRSRLNCSTRKSSCPRESVTLRTHGLTRKLLFAKDQTSLAVNLFEDIASIVKDRLHDLISKNELRSNLEKEINEDQALLKIGSEFYKAFGLNMKLEKNAEKGMSDDVQDAFSLLREEGFSFRAWSDLITLARKKMFFQQNASTDKSPVKFKMMNLQTLRAGVSLRAILEVSARKEKAIGIVYEVPKNTKTLAFSLEIKKKGDRNFFGKKPKNLVASSMGIMANNDYTAPAWATGAISPNNGKRVILNDYWPINRDGLLVVSSQGRKLEILSSKKYIESVTARRELYRRFREREVDFFTLGQLYLFGGVNLIHPEMAKTKNCTSKNILATSEDERVFLVKLFCENTYNAVEIVKSLGAARAFNFDAQSAHYDRHVDAKGNDYGVLGVNHIAYSKFSIVTLEPSESMKEGKSYFCGSSMSDCELKDYLQKQYKINP